MKKIYVIPLLVIALCWSTYAADCQTLQGDEQKSCTQSVIDSYFLSDSDTAFVDTIVAKISSKIDTVKQALITLISNTEHNPKLMFNYHIRAILQSASSMLQAQSLALCLTQKGVIMYGTERCPHCQNQKKLFGTAFASIHYVDCDLFPAQCEAANVQGYPTRVGLWITSPGQQPLSDIADTFSCTMQ